MKTIATFALFASASLLTIAGCGAAPDASDTQESADALRTRSHAVINAGTYVAAPSTRLAADGMNSLRSKGELLTLVLKTDGTFYRAVSTQDDCIDGHCRAGHLEGTFSVSKSKGKSEYVLANVDGDEVERWELTGSNRDGFTLTNADSGVASELEASVRYRWCKTKKDCALQDEGIANPTGQGYQCSGASGGIENGACIALDADR